MARQMITVAVCDKCKEKGREDDFAMDISLDTPMQKRASTFDLCQSCLGEFRQALDPFLNIGRALPKTSKTQAMALPPAPAAVSPIRSEDPALPFPCGVEGCLDEAGQPRSFTTAQGVGMHRRRKHGIQGNIKVA